MIRLVLCLIMLASLASVSNAQGFDQPRPRFEVVDVASNDVLNIRAAPEVTAEKIGEYLPGDANIEVIRESPDGRWAMVGVGERNGWVALRFLTSQQEMPLAIPDPMLCFGTEPFWSMVMDESGAAFNDPERGRISTELTQSYTAPNGHFARFDTPDTAIRLTIYQGYCSDGMSDREFGFSAALYFQSAQGSRVHSGCCTFDGH